MGALVLGVLAVRTGIGPFVDGLRLTNPGALAAAAVLNAVGTVCSAWRWQVVATALGVRVPLPSAVAAVYRAQFLNATLPGGVLGDVDRAVDHGRRTGARARSARAVVWERTLGQVVQVPVTIAIVLLVPSPLRPVAVVACGAVIASSLVGAVLALATRRHRLLGRVVRGAVTDLRTIARAARDRRSIAAASATALTCHLLVFVLAAHVAGVGLSAQVLVIAAVVLLAASLPVNVAGWGPRDGVAAWAFAAAGLGAATGVTTAVVFGVMALAATFPGAVVLLAGTLVDRPARALEEVARA